MEYTEEKIKNQLLAMNKANQILNDIMDLSDLSLITALGVIHMADAILRYDTINFINKRREVIKDQVKPEGKVNG